MTGPTEKLKAYALSLGFDLVGITSANPLDEDVQRLGSWLRQGFAGEMAYLERDADRRGDPRALMSEARSVISLALNYYTGYPGAQERDHSTRSKVARYAWGEDYHRIIEEKLRGLVTYIEGLGGRCARGRGDIDHGPILERALARRAGLGFIGKNTHLITHEFGSWVFLAEVITDLELLPDRPLEGKSDGCGSCRLCLDACPTGALVEPYQLDARSCISYWTIEQKGPIPTPVRPQLGEWGFGCDICQEVCPYNFQPVETREERLGADRGLGRSLDHLREDWRDGLSRSALSRAKPRGILRNLAVAMGNRADEEDLPRLIKMLEESDPLIREHVIWAIAEIRRKRVVAAALESVPPGIENRREGESRLPLFLPQRADSPGSRAEDEAI